MEIKTLAEILAEEGIATTTKRTNINRTNIEETKKIEATKLTTKQTKIAKKKNKESKHKTRKSKQKPLPYHQQKAIKEIVPLTNNSTNLTPSKNEDETFTKNNHNVNNFGGINQSANIDKSDSINELDNIGKLDNITAQLTLKTAEQRQAEIDEIKSERRLRWLAFYYLSTREHSAEELRQKLLNKQQDPEKIEDLLLEFAEKGYQSDYRTAFMLIREGIRKGRGRNRIKQDFFKRKISLPNNIDELIDIANETSAEFFDLIDETNEYNKVHASHQVNWLKLAVEARVKKYGSEIPTQAKDKGKQLRFLQYRGFQNDICFEALRHNLETIS